MSDAAMLPCDQVVAKLWEYIDGELTDLRAAEIQKHLEICARCFPQYDFQRAFLALLARHNRQPMPPELRHRVFERLLAENAEAGAGAEAELLLHRTGWWERLKRYLFRP